MQFLLDVTVKDKNKSFFFLTDEVDQNTNLDRHEFIIVQTAEYKFSKCVQAGDGRETCIQK